MSPTYVDTSAAAKLLIEEADSEAASAWVEQVLTDGGSLVSSLLLETELRRFAVRAGVPQSSVTAVLDGIALAEMPPSLFLEAGLFADPTLRSLDALHLAAAIRLDVDAVLTYDERLAVAAGDLGLHVATPRDS